MPLIASHIDFAIKQIGDMFPNDQTRNYFLLGNLLPDIRYLTGQSREDTHLIVSNIEDLLAEIAKIKKTENRQVRLIKFGVAYHCFIDDWWRKQVFIPSTSKLIGLALQIIDENNAFFAISRSEMVDCLKTTETLPFLNNSKEVVDSWINFIRTYLLTERFTTNSLSVWLMARLKRNEGETRELLSQIERIEKNPEFLQKILYVRQNGLPSDVKNIINTAWLK